MNSNLKYIKLQIEIPKKIWIYKISKLFPDEILTLNYSTSISKNKRQVFLSTISKKNIEEIFNHLKKEKQVSEIEFFGENIKLVFKLNFLAKILHHKLTIIFPVTIHNGYATIEVFANKNQILLFKKVFKKIKILRISNQENKKEELTLKQKEILETAHMLGYYQIPRKITLTELTKKLKISKSTLSESLRVAENKIITNYLMKKE